VTEQSVGARAAAWIDGIVTQYPRRVAGSESERRAHEQLKGELEALGAREAALLPFRHNRSLYANMALHFLIALVGSALLIWGVSAWAALALHVFTVVSYTLESNKRAMVLRHVFPWHGSQNLVATSPARGALKRRVVVVAHMDAAFTGILFHPAVLKQALKPPPLEALMFLRKSMLVSTGSVALLALMDVVALVGAAPSRWGWAVGAMSVPALLTVVFNGQVVVQDTVVPGANDNLTGCFALKELAARLIPEQPDGVELVFVATGCEEAGTGGAWALSEQQRGQWSPADTVVIGVDTLSGGVLHYFEEGELVAAPVPARLEGLVREVLPDLPKYPIPSGATDALPFLARGYEAMTFGCVDPDIGAPRNYHRPSDSVANLDLEQLERSLGQIEAYLRALIARG
jgi:hypothetical protein